MGNVSVVIGAQWGDEGKGRWIDILAADYDIVARFQGGNNAGHTLYVNGEKVVLHQIPSGIFQPNHTCALTAGVVVNPVQMIEEIERLKKFAKVTSERLWLSARAHVITPWHIYLDGKQEEGASQPIGTTKRGIGPTYADKAARQGLRLGNYVKEQARRNWVEKNAKQNPQFHQHLEGHAEDWQRFHEAAAKLAAFVGDTEARLRQEIATGKRLLFEGAQGALLDIDHGTYPYVTSSSTSAGGSYASLGFSPKEINKIYGVAKAYVTRVGEGPFPTELKDSVGENLRKKGHEFGATTGRPRRCGWLDAVALRYACQISGMDGIILNKIDILTGEKEIKIATAYSHPKLGKITDFPWDEEVLAQCTPVYESHPGWREDIPLTGKISDLPANARAYVQAVEKAVGTKVIMVGTGVNRSDALYS